MANLQLSLFGYDVPILLVEQSGGGYAVATKTVVRSTAMAAGDKSLALFGGSFSIRLVLNADGQSYSLATATAVNPKPAGDVTVPLFGMNASIRLVQLAAGDYALAVAAQ